jgi:hypothetical protein
MKKNIDNLEMLLNFYDPDMKVVMIFRTENGKTEILYTDRKGNLKSKTVSLSMQSHRRFMKCLNDNFQNIRETRFDY